MRRSKIITIEGLGEITVKELTVAQVTEMAERVQRPDRPNYLIEAILETRLPMEAVVLATGLAEEKLNSDITPSEAAQLWEAVAEVNSFLSRKLDGQKAAEAGTP